MLHITMLMVHNQSVMNIEKVNQHKHRQGFTIVELLIVIVVIGILATITIVAYNGVQTKAKAIALISGINDVENAFRGLSVDQNRSTWWRDNGATDPIYAGSPGNPDLSLIIANTGLSDYLQKVPAGSSTNSWQYDNDGDTRLTSACQTAGTEGSGWSGVVLAIGDVTNAVLLEVDKEIDDGDVFCGKIRASSATQTGLLYQLSFTPNIQ
jgi:prepilin-type N-terminal cleavage/methylation domain-containing protein